MALVNEIEVVSKPLAKLTHAIRPCTASYEIGGYHQLDTYASLEGKSTGDVKQAVRFGCN